MAIQAQAYFDESGSHGGSPILCLAGYIFRKSEAIKLGHEWRKVLRWKQLPYFRMVECAHGNGPFANLTKQERVEVATRMIEIIKSRAVQGLAVTANSEELAELILAQREIERVYESPYSFCAHTVLKGVSYWIQAQIRHVDEMAYFFEAGHASATHANRIMHQMFQQQNVKEEYRYVGHAFVEKQKSPAIQAADLLAWQWFKDKKNQLEGRPRRKDCESLLRLHHTASHLSRDSMAEMMQMYASKRSSAISQSLQGLSF